VWYTAAYRLSGDFRKSHNTSNTAYENPATKSLNQYQRISQREYLQGGQEHELARF
jgi:hypothetical protein